MPKKKSTGENKPKVNNPNVMGLRAAVVEQAMDCGAAPVTLGRRILRTETAGFVMLSMLLYHLE